MDSRELSRALRPLGVAEARWLEETGSTNDDALAWADAGAPDFSLVAADAQTRGRGRLNRHWVTHPGASLAFSFIFRPTPAEAPYAGLFSPLGALAVSHALETLCGLKPQIKWPNDVLLQGKKTCGILAEGNWSGATPQAIVVGVGLNIAASSAPPAAETFFPATCIEEHTAVAVERWALLREVVRAASAWRANIGSAAFLQAWESRLAFREQAVQISPPSGPALTGVCGGVTAQGELRLRLANATEIIIPAGDVRLRPVES